MKYFLGIDGGGTRTTAAVTDEKGTILLKKQGKTINFYAVGMESARNNLSDLMNDIHAEIGNIVFNGAFIGCSALDAEADEKITDELCGSIIAAKAVKMHSDVYIALKSLNVDVCPCVIICGTGSMAIAEDEQGREHISGGWGHIIGDEGSAYSIAINALKACCVFCDKGEAAPLLKSANEYFKVDNFRKAIDIIYSPEASKDIVAGFAAAVGALAENGDEAAKAIVTDEAKSAAKTVSILLDKIKGCSVVGLYGGVFQHNEIFTNAFNDEIKKAYPDIKTELLTIPPEESAARLAARL